MKIYVGFSMMVDAFREYGREHQFSYDALRAIFDYYEGWEDSTGQEIELDVIGICCDWTEYIDAMEAASDHGEEFTDEESALDWLNDRTMVIEFEGGIVVGAW